MNRSIGHNLKRKTLFAVVLTLLLVTGNLTLLLSASALPFSAMSATSLPPGKGTLEALLTETVQAYELTPFPTGTLWLFPDKGAYITPFPKTPYPSTPAGTGAIFTLPIDKSYGKILGINPINEWVGIDNGRTTTVYAGSVYGNDSLGAVLVRIYNPSGLMFPDGGSYLPPTQAGPLQVIGAQGARLILHAAGGTTFYFDALGEKFTNSLTDAVPSITPWPLTATPSLTPTLNGDAPHNPGVPTLSPSYSLMNFILYHAGDEHWFRVRSPVAGTIQVHLDNLTTDYDLYVYSVTRTNHGGIGVDGKSITPGTTSELVTILNAPADDYMIRVVGVNGAFDPTHPYQLEIDIPVTVGDLRAKTADCVTDHDLGNSLNAKIDHQDWTPFINEVEAQSGKKITPECAHAMIGMATYLLNNSPTPMPKP